MNTSRKPSNTLIWLSALVGLAALLAAGAGLFWRGAGAAYTFTTLHGETVQIYGQGLYRYDSAFKAPILRGTDAVMFFVAVPVLAAAVWLYRRGSSPAAAPPAAAGPKGARLPVPGRAGASVRGQLLLAGVLLCFLYNAASLILGAAYNALFLLYLVYFSASFYAFILAFASVDRPALAAHISPRMPNRGLAAFLCLAGLSPCVWLIPVIAAVVQGQPAPAGLAHYTTDVTTVLDVSLITPACFLAGALLLRRAPLGYLLGSTLLVLLSLIGLIVVGQTGMQILDGVRLGAGEIAAFVAPFVSLSAIATGLNFRLIQHIAEPDAEHA